MTHPSPQNDPHDPRILALLLHLQRWPYDAETGSDLTLTAETLQWQASRVFASGSTSTAPAAVWPTDWHGALQGLVEDGLVARHPGGTFKLTDTGHTQARSAHRGWIARGFGGLLCRASESAAYEEFCRRSMDLAVGQFSPVDARQLALVLSCVQGALRDQSSPGRILDLGCGTGGISAWLASQTNAVVYGVDLAKSSVETGGQRYAHLGDRLRLRVGDLHDMPLPAASFDVLVAIDVLAFLDEPETAFDNWLRLVAPAGYLVVLGSTKLQDTSPPPGSIPLGALPDFSTAEFSTHFLDLSLLERCVWRRQAIALDTLREDFRQEDNLPLYDLLSQEARRCGRWANEGQTRRWLAVLRPV